MSDTPNLRSTKDDLLDPSRRSFAHTDLRPSNIIVDGLTVVGFTSSDSLHSTTWSNNSIVDQLNTARLSWWDTLKPAPILVASDSEALRMRYVATTADNFRGKIFVSPDVVKINFPDSISASDASEVSNLSRLVGQPTSRDVEARLTKSEMHVAGGSIKREKEGCWVEHLSWFIPKEIREPWLGDLLEDRERMSSKGRNQAHIEWATGIQLLLLLANRLWAKFGWGLLIYNRVSEWFSANK
jgi:hypothetical protein